MTPNLPLAGDTREGPQACNSSEAAARRRQVPARLAQQGDSTPHASGAFMCSAQPGFYGVRRTLSDLKLETACQEVSLAGSALPLSNAMHCYAHIWCKSPSNRMCNTDMHADWLLRMLPASTLLRVSASCMS